MSNGIRQVEVVTRIIVLVLAIIIVAFFITACQNTIELKNVSSPADKPLISKKVQEEDFAFPTKDPSVEEGKKLFAANCASCHGFKNETGKQNFTLKYVNSVAPSHLFKAITNSPKHHSFKDKLSIKERWDVVMYLRFVLFGLPENYDDVKVKFGANCANCHGTRGFGDGDIHYFLNPPPANFNQFDKWYEKTDEYLFERISHGKPWTAMPPWEGRVDKDKNFVFDERFIWELVKYVRHFGYTTGKDLLRDEKLFKTNSQDEVRK